MKDLAAELVQKIMQNSFVEIEASGRHVHLSEADAMALFGHRLTPKRELSQPGQYVCHERVCLVGARCEMTNVAVLGPERAQSQVEISLSDCNALGIQAPVRLSGSIEGTCGITLRAEHRQITLQKGVIVAKRHIHMTPQDAKAQNVRNGDKVKLRCLTSRPLIFEDVEVRVSDKFRTAAHLDYDEANACGFAKGDLGVICHG